MNNLMIFENKQVEVFRWNGQVVFNPYHVGDCLNIKDTKSSIRDFNERQVIKLKNSDVHDMHFRKLNNAGENFLTESGVYKLIFKSKKEEAEKFQDWVTDEVLPAIRETGGYIGADENMTDEEIMAKALMVAQKTISKKDELLKAKDMELVGVKQDLNNKNRFINQIAVSENSLLVREVAKIASKQGVVIGEKRLWCKLREWGFVFKNSTEAKQEGIDRGYFEIVEGSKTAKGKAFTYHTTRITGKGQVYIINRLLKEQEVV